MKHWAGWLAVVALSAGCFAGEEAKEGGWVALFDGESLEGWKASEKADAWSVRDGMLAAEGGRSHLFYVGPVEDHDFKNFEFQAEVMTTRGSNSGIYFHTRYQERGWPRQGFEAQVNNTHGDWKKTGSLYNIVNVRRAPAKDNEWFDYHIVVDGREVTIEINGEVVTEWTQPEDARRKLSSGTFALQAHDPKSKVYYRNIRVKPLPD
ncbi:MAG: DUF1080 domain-containing protein [Candidatus Brocadiia bacterium]